MVKFKKQAQPQATHLPHHPARCPRPVHGDIIFATSEARTFGVHLPKYYIPDIKEGGGNRNRNQKFGANLEVFGEIYIYIIYSYIYILFV